MLKVVLDTNILVSSLLTYGPPAVIVDLVADGKIVPYYGELIIQEYWDVLSREKFNFSSSQVFRLINDITRAGMAVKKIQTGRKKMYDEGDRIFYDTAVISQSYLITGNIRHFPKETFIVSPAQFLTLYRGK